MLFLRSLDGARAARTYLGAFFRSWIDNSNNKNNDKHGLRNLHEDCHDVRFGHGQLVIDSVFDTVVDTVCDSHGNAHYDALELEWAAELYVKSLRLEVFALHASLVAAFAALHATDITRLTQITATGFPSDGALANGASLLGVQGVAWSAADAALYLSDANRHTVFAIDRVKNSSVY